MGATIHAAMGWLPVLLMALLALATWWLVKNTPLPGPDTTLAPPRHEPDYTMTDFSVRRFAADGALQVQIEGRMLRHYPDTDTLEIDAPRIRHHTPDGRETVARANRAIANGDATEVQLQGGASVVRGAVPGGASGADNAAAGARGSSGAPIEFRGEFLHVFANSERVRSHLPVVVTKGGTELRAEGIEYDHLARTIDLKGRTRAVFAPRAGAGASPGG